jgi:cytochrome c oxidase cbb3-type subunit 3
MSLMAGTVLVLAGIAVRIGAQAPAAPAPGVGPAPAAQGPGPGGAGAGQAGRGRGRGPGTFPAQQRQLDTTLIARGQALYGISCRSCHGPDLRGGDMGGPNLLRSPVTLADKQGELIKPIILQGRLNTGGGPVMPPLSMSDDDIRAVAEYIHSVLASAAGQGAPPPGPPVVLNILVGDAKAGQAYFAARCSSCHSATGDLQGIATRLADPKALQNAWVAGTAGGGGRGGGTDRRTVTVTVTQPSGERIQGRLDRLDDFLVVMTPADGRQRSFARRGGAPKIEVNDPMAGHRQLLEVLTDKDMHDVTAYLVTLK